jgi:hypothetical protein
MKLCGVGIPDARTFPGYIFSGIVLSWGGAAGGTMIAVKGPLGAWGIENISAECNISAAIGLLVTSGHDGSVVNFTTDQYTAAGIKTNCVEPFGALFNTDANHNYFLNIRTIGGAAGSDGIFLDGCPSGAANSDFNVFVNVFANQPSTGSAIHLKTCDSNTFIGCQFLTQGPPAPALLFDYTGPGGIFPVSNAFFACTVGNPAAPIAANLGSPGAPYGYYNRLFMTNANGEPFVNLPGLSNGFMATVTVANLPPVPFEGLELVISNSNTNTPGATVSGTGAFKVLAAYSGVSWRVVVDLS